MNAWDAFTVVIMGVIGFCMSLVVLLIGGLLSMGLWLMGLIIAGTALALFAWEYVSDRFDAIIMRRIFGMKESAATRAAERRDRRLGRNSFALGAVLALMAAQIWTPAEIARMF